MQPDQWQGQGSDTADGKDDKGRPEIPLETVLDRAGEGGRMQKLAAVLALDCLVLNLFGTEWTLLHGSFLSVNRIVSTAQRLACARFHADQLRN